jgi:cob(I)alamin adenosyltransferase
MKIYTKTGDDGTTGLFGGSRLSKGSVRIDSYGTVDELNSLLGVVRSSGQDDEIERMLQIIQNHLFAVGADLAAPLDTLSKSTIRVSDGMITQLEGFIDSLDQRLPELRNFILPHGVITASILHSARAVCRRAERLIVRLSNDEEINHYVVIYMNRLSDLLFVMARYVNQKAGNDDTLWSGSQGT